MKRVHRRLVTLLVPVVVLATAAGLVAAADQTILGNQLVVKNPGVPTKRSVSGSASEHASASAIVGDPRGAGAVLEILVNGGAASAQRFVLPQGTSSTGKPFWAASGTGYAYKDAKGNNGPVTSVKIARSSSGNFSIRVGLKGKYGAIAVVPPNPGTDGCLAITIVGGDRYSIAYGVESSIKNQDTRLFSAKHPAFEAICPAVATPTATLTATPTPTFTPSPSPTATGAAACAASSFLDVTGAAGPGGTYASLHPSLSASCGASAVTVSSNGIPTYQYNALTPNGLQAKSYTFTFPRQPAIAAATTAVPLLGNVGVAVNGIPVYGVNEGPQPASDAYGDPIAANILDECGSHSAQQGTFHNHALQVKCLVQSAVSESQPWNDPDPSPSDPSPIVAYAFDGFPIYGPYECVDAGCSAVQKMLSSWDNTGYQAGTVGCASSAACSSGYCTAVMINGAETTACAPKTCVWSNNDYAVKAGSQYLDQCNGHVGPNGDYHYHTTSTFPYILGCYRGTPTNNGGSGTPPGGTCP
jgi:hypothetical protein